MKNKQAILKKTASNTTLLLVVAAALAVALGAVWLKKAADDFGEYRELITHERSVLSVLEQNHQNIEELQREASILRQEGLTENRILGALPLRYQPAFDLANMELLANASGVQIQDISVNLIDGGSSIVPVTTGEVEGLMPYMVQATILGSYNGLKNWLSNIETSKQPMIVSGFQIASSDNLLSAQVTMVLYTQESGLGEESLEEMFVEEAE